MLAAATRKTRSCPEHRPRKESRMWEVSQQHKGLLVLLLDQSADADASSRALFANRVIRNLSMSFSTESGVRDALDLCVLGYCSGDDGKPIIRHALSGRSCNRDVLPLHEVVNHPSRYETAVSFIPDEATGEFLKVPYSIPLWVDTAAEGHGLLGLALLRATLVVDLWVARHPASPPPVVLNISSGIFRGADPEPYACALCSRGTLQGKVVLGNAIEASAATYSDHPPVTLCHERLYRMSSSLPEHLLRTLRADGKDLLQDARWFAINSEIHDWIISRILFYDD